MPVKLLGVIKYSVNGVAKKKIHYQGEASNAVIIISGDDKRMTAGEVCEVIASKEKIPLKDIVMRPSLKINLDKKAKKVKKEEKNLWSRNS